MKKYIITLFFCSFYFTSFAQNQVQVFDGDTFYYNNLKIRLYNIDRPEMFQKGGKESKEQLTKLLRNKVLRYKILKFDNYKRAICAVYVDDKDVSLEMVRLGYSTVYRRYCSSSVFYSAEKEAKRQKKGIWKYDFITPEKFRKWKNN